ncbi:MAG TPA: hypothetical protein VK168_09975 [Saprospiraceae bacterium]|nr:hypothetical protein [Saprospiraceae bacterium]
MIPNSSINTIFSVFTERGHEEYHGEPVSQLEHAVQAAVLAREQYPNDPEFIIAAFLHDFGHLCNSPQGDMDGYGQWNHEMIGSKTLQELGFSAKVTSLVENHVLAKRYLVSTDPDYFNGLSEASRITLEKQGGRLSIEEQTAFEADPLFHQHIALRRIDEKAKIMNLSTDTAWLETLMKKHF